MFLIRAVLREITESAKVILHCREDFILNAFRHVQDGLACFFQSGLISGFTRTGGVGPEMVKRQLFHRHLPGGLNRQLIKGQLGILLQIVNREKVFIGLIVDYRNAILELVDAVDLPPNGMPSISILNEYSTAIGSLKPGVWILQNSDSSCLPYSLYRSSCSGDS